jgi:hypothetical protein
VGKGLLPAETLVARAKRLINFFTIPKQTERLIEIQKSMKNNQHKVKILFLFINFINFINFDFIILLI